ncbi:MAG TPA: Jag N-terminal domain-containing protein [Candidatus Omnitrophota bacterium]|nr:Jag N-terminal domain-containing protein [Candidatus Omnitrophota bacterium]HPD84588.1 Jag N-terminal domain-containing protein [Candidatus Omnitrophota bacterium]HRZ03446.1 Jag N-terminal domain-containing protein [Candidatus Omnitrophota bacterium]
MFNAPKSIESDGATVEEAIGKALKILGVPKEAVKIKIVSEEKMGLFGMAGSKPARVIVTLKPYKEK